MENRKNRLEEIRLVILYCITIACTIALVCGIFYYYSNKDNDETIYNINISYVTDPGKVTFTWDEVEGATAYEIYVRSSTSDYKKLGQVMENYVNIGGLKAGEEYIFRIRVYTQDSETSQVYGGYTQEFPVIA